MTSVHDFSVKTIEGESRSLADYAGRVLLVVNVASKCGLTPHYEGLEALYRKHKDEGLVVLGFPCNDFGAQEPGSEAEIKSFCAARYDVTFPLFAKIKVLGAQQEPLYAHLTAAASTPEAAGDIKWNFTKFVVDRRGQVLARFAPPTPPDDPGLLAAIARALADGAAP